MPKITLSNVRTVTGMPEQLSWQESDVIQVLKQFNPNLRPGGKVAVASLYSGASRARLESGNILAGVNSLVKKGILELTDRDSNVMLTEEGFENHW